jgi:hypothetical protein
VDKKQRIELVVNRFGRCYFLRYQPGGAQAKLFADEDFVGWLGVEVGREPGVILRVVGDIELVPPTALGMPEGTEEAMDHRLLVEAESYLLTLLEGRLREELITEHPDARKILREIMRSPCARGRRIAQEHHDNAFDLKALPYLVATEIRSAVEGVGRNMAQMLEEVGEEDLSDRIWQYVRDTLEQWEREDTEVEDEARAR